MRKVSEERVAAGIFAFFAVVFWPLRCRTFGPGDSGQHVLAALTWGVSRPPGYPLYDLLGWLWTRLPWADAPAAVDGLSGLYAAGAAAFFYLVLRRQACGRPAALSAAALMAFSPLFWYYAEVAEVRSLNNLLALAAAYFLLAWLASAKKAHALAFGAAFGLGVSHHPTFVLLAPAFAYAAWPQRRRISRHWFEATLCAAAGLALPYLILWLRLRWGPAPAYNPDQVRTFADVAALFTRKNTGGYLNMFAHRRPILSGFRMRDFLLHADWMVSGLSGGLGGIGLLAAAGGVAALWRKGRRRLIFWQLWFLGAALVFLLISSQQMPPLDPDYLRAVSLRFYLLPMIGLFALAAAAFDWLLARARPALGWTLAAVACLFPLIHPVSLRGRDWAKIYGEEILRASGPRDFVLLAADDSIVSTTYLDVVERRAADRVFLLPWLFNYGAYLDRLSRRHPGLTIPRGRDGAASQNMRDWLKANPGRGLCAEGVDLANLRREFPFAGMRGVLAVAREKPQSAEERSREAAAFSRSPLARLVVRGVFLDTQEIYLAATVARLGEAYGSLAR